MAYDKGLAERLRDILRDQDKVEEKKMFGGLCFMVSKHMCCGVAGEKLMARVGAENYEKSLSKKHVKEMDFTGKPMKGMVYVEPEGIAEDEDLSIGCIFVCNLPNLCHQNNEISHCPWSCWWGRWDDITPVGRGSGVFA